MRKPTHLDDLLASLSEGNKRLTACIAALKSLGDEAKLDYQINSAEGTVYLKQCVGCDHLYQEPAPTSCDCMENPANEYRDYIAVPLNKENCESNRDYKISGTPA